MHDVVVKSYLFIYFLNNYSQLAINANMKNTDQHIMLLGWSADEDKSEAVVIDIERENCAPRIELQGTSRFIAIFVA